MFKHPLAMAACMVLGSTFADWPKHPKYGFPVYTNAPSGRQLSGQHAPASTPALSPADQQKSFVVPKGFEVRLFASEPDIANPVAMTWDDRGRLWVLELYEYPLGTKPGETGRDRIKILEDSDGDGTADKVTVFADGMTLATGLLVGNDGVYVGQAPHLYLMRDTDGDDVADSKVIVQTGFGLEDRHELLNGFTWGPDGQMYMTHGVFTRTEAKVPGSTNPPVMLTAGVARFDTTSKKLEVFAEGTSNPWGVDFDARGNAFVSACVIDHLFHLAPGGLYARQAGQPPHPYAYELLPSIVDFNHHMAAFAGVNVYQGDQWPKEWLGEILVGNIHQNALNNDHVEPKGASFKAFKRPDFLTTKDGWFMPVSTQTGPDGAAWVMDWYDKYPCYQNANADPAGVDRERGRIWRVVWVGDQPGKAVPSRPAGLQLSKSSSEELLQTLKHPNVWHRRMAQRILNGRKDSATREPLKQLVKDGATLDSRLAAFWTLFSSGLVDDEILDVCAKSTELALRMWSARFSGERRNLSDATADRIFRLAADPEPTVRCAAATAMRFFSSTSLTVDTRAPMIPIGAPIGQLMVSLIEGSKAGDDPLINFMIWHAMEPLIAKRSESVLGWFGAQGTNNLPLSGRLLSKLMRRICDTRQVSTLDRAVAFLDGLADEPKSHQLAIAALDGLIEGQRGKALTPGLPTKATMDKLLASSSKDVISRAQQLGTLWGDAAALSAVIGRIKDSALAVPDRVRAIQASRQSKADDVRSALLGVVTQSSAPEEVRIEAIRALSDVGSDTTPGDLIREWSKLTPAVRRVTADVLSSRGNWVWALYTALETGKVDRSDIPIPVIRNLATHKSVPIRNKAATLFGRVKDTPADKLKLIAEKRRMVIDGPVDLAAGYEVAKRNCLTCHLLHGEGAQVGPDLTGVGRSSLDALLHNVIHPNEIIGQGYENVIVETGDDRTLSGRLIEKSDARVRLLLAGPQEEVIATGDIRKLTVSENSVMPEGLEQMPDADFRNMIWYILAPPKDNRPLTPERRKELIGNPDSALVAPAATDGESVAMWNPAWRIESNGSAGASTKFPEWESRANVLMTRFATSGAAFVRTVDLAGVSSALMLTVAAEQDGDWELRVFANGRELVNEPIYRGAEVWRTLPVDLSSFSSGKLELRVEHHPGSSDKSDAYWGRLELIPSQLAKK